MEDHNAHLITFRTWAMQEAQSAAASVKPGSVFIGAIPEAEKRGIKCPMTKSIFVAIFVNSIPKRITTNVSGVILAD